MTLEFSANGERYRIFRETSKRSQKSPQLERFHEDTGEFLPEEVDRVKDANAFIERLLLMDYEAFIRSVLLPQGEFQEFLAGDRDQRRKVLDRLLRLGVYSVMQQRANALSAQERGEADQIRGRLEKELSDATVDALASAQDMLDRLTEEARELSGKRDALEIAARAAEQLLAATTRGHNEERDAEKAAAALEEARKTLEGGENAIADLDTRIGQLRGKAKETDYDADLHLKLTGAVTDAQERDAIESRINALGVEAGKVREDLERIQAAASAARNRVAEAVSTVAAASDAYEAVRKSNAAVLLRTALSAGDPCPVCGQAVGNLPPGRHGDLDRVRTNLDNARSEEKKAEKATADVERDAAVLAERGAKLEQQLSDVKVDRERRTESLAAALGTPDIATEELKLRVATLDSARQLLDAFRKQDQELVEQREKQAQGLLAAQASVATLEAQASSHRREFEAAEKEASETRTEIERMATKHGWQDVLKALSTGGDVNAAVKQGLHQAQERETAVNQDIGASRTRIDQIKQNIALAEELRTRERQHNEAARLAKDLATVLRADGLPAFVRESAMQTLANGGSTWLRKVSMGRYDLKVKGQDFGVADLWNAGEERPVQTLSGGETFLASLSLALALAEQLPGMSSDGDSATLESLFIDEGFSHLDEDTLKTVADALEVLGADRRRLIGVITHVSALAERLPARIVVHKDSTGGPSTVTVE